MVMRKAGKGKSRTCLICSHEITLLNNDEDFSWDMHKQEEFHRKSRLKKENQNMLSPKADTHMCIQRMKEFFGSKDNIEKRTKDLIILANKELQKNETNEIVIKAIARIFRQVYPHNFIVRPFGSRITGLTTKASGDLDLFVDTSSEPPDKTLVESPEMENHFLKKVGEYMKKYEADTWVNVHEILACRTPIIKAVHYDTKMQCDITVMNGLGNVNTQLMCLYLNNIPKLRPLILMIREWSSDCYFVREINNYALSLLVLFYLQKDLYAPPVCTFEFDNNKPTTLISGYECVNYDEVNFDWSTVKSTEKVSMKELLTGFFTFYSEFDFSNNVICPLIGKAINKKLFTSNGKQLPKEMRCYVQKLKNTNKVTGPEIFYINNKGMNVQDPIDLAHNLTKATREQHLNDFIDMCDSAKRALQLIN